MSILSQRFWPKNLKVSRPAHEVLVQEAADLLAKESIAPVDPVKGQFVSSYFAVTKAHNPGKFRPILNLKSSTSLSQNINLGCKVSSKYRIGFKRMLGSVAWT